MESVEDFRLRRARPGWPTTCRPTSMASRGAPRPGRWKHERALQRILFDGEVRRDLLPEGVRRPRPHHRAPGCVHGGVVPLRHAAYALNVPHRSGSWRRPSSITAPTSRRLAHLPRILSGDELWVQFLVRAERWVRPGRCLTRADQDGDTFVLNGGAKIWSSGAAERGLRHVPGPHQLGRPEAPRRSPCSSAEIHQPGVTVEQIKQVDGSMEFCQEFFDDVPPLRARRGWATSTTGGTSPPACWCTSAWRPAAPRRTRAVGGAERPRGERRPPDRRRPQRRRGRRTPRGPMRSGRGHHPASACTSTLNLRLTQGMARGAMPPPTGSIHDALRGAGDDAPDGDQPRARSAPEAAVWPDCRARPRRRADRHLLADATRAGPSAGEQRDPAQHHQRAAPRGCAEPPAIATSPTARSARGGAEPPAEELRRELRAWLGAHWSPDQRRVALGGDGARQGRRRASPPTASGAPKLVDAGWGCHLLAGRASRGAGRRAPRAARLHRGMAPRPVLCRPR